MHNSWSAKCSTDTAQFMGWQRAPGSTWTAASKAKAAATKQQTKPKQTKAKQSNANQTNQAIKHPKLSKQKETGTENKEEGGGMGDRGLDQHALGK